MFILIFISFIYVSAEQYWIEDTGNGYNIWTKLNLTAGETTIYVQKTEGYSPNGDAVFEFFDDFDGAELDTTKWDSDINTYLISNSILNTQSPYCIVSKQIFSGNIIAEMKWKDDEFSRSPSLMFLKTDRNNGVFAGYGEWGSPYDNDFNIFTTGNYNSNFNYNVKVCSGDIPIDTTKWHKSTAKYVDGQFIATLDDDTTIQYGYAMTDYYVALGSPTGRTYNEEYDYIFVRKYADQEPTVSVEQIDDTNWKITITNNNDYDLTDFQIPIEGIPLISNTESLLLTNTFSNENENIEIDILNASNETGFVELRIYNYTNSKYFIINWDDGTIDNISAETNETIVSHTYDLLHIIKPSIIPKITGYDDGGNLTTSKTVDFNLIYPFDKFLETSVNYYEIRIANPYNENITNYDLDLILTADNFDFWDTNLKPLGTNIYFRDENQYLKHYISYFNQATAQAEIHVNIPYIAPNSYKSIYLAFAENDVPQYTFTGDNRTLLYIVVPHKQGNIPSTNNDSLIMKSADIANLTQIAVLFVDENSLVAGCLKSGIIQFIDDKGNRVVYTFDSPTYSIVNVSAETPNGTIVLTTSDGITRKVRYTTTEGLGNLVLVPNYNVVPLEVRGEGEVVIKSGGWIVTTEQAPCQIPLAVGGIYDIYVDGVLQRKDYTMTQSLTIVPVSKLNADEIIIYNDIKRKDNVSMIHTILSNKDAIITIYNDTTIIQTDTIPANEKREYIVPIGAKYKITVDGVEIKEGEYIERDLGLLITLKEWISPKWYMIFATAIVILTLLAGTYISAHVALTLAMLEILLFNYIDVFQLDPISKTVLSLLSILIVLIMWFKR